MTTLLVRQPILPKPAPWPPLIVVGAAAAAGLFAVRGYVGPPWKGLLDPLACAAHGAALTLLLGLLFDAARFRAWSRQLDRLGRDDDRPNWAAAAIAQCLAQFDHLPTPDAVQRKFREGQAVWIERAEFRCNLYLVLAALLGLPLQLVALRQIATTETPSRALQVISIPLAVAGLEVLAVALPAYLMRRAWYDLFEEWLWRVKAEETVRRLYPAAGWHDTMTSASGSARSAHTGASTPMTHGSEAHTTRSAFYPDSSTATTAPHDPHQNHIGSTPLGGDLKMPDDPSTATDEDDGLVIRR